MRVLHLIERLTLGGASRSLIAAAGQSRWHHRVLALRPSDARALALAQAAGIEVAGSGDLHAEIRASDILHIHFWNAPDLYAALRRPTPPCRIVLTSHILGSTRPHILTREVQGLADIVIGTTPATPADRTIPEAADFRRLAGLRRSPQDRFTIGYVGALDFAKLHPDYVAMHAALGGEFKVVVAGGGPDLRTLQRQAVQAGVNERFEWAGPTEDIAAALGKADIFGYPLCEGNFATTELVLHEALFAGLPCVVLANGGAAHTIVHGETGFLARDPEDYVERVRALRDDPTLRARMGLAASAHARAHFGAARIAERVDSVYAETMRFTRQPRRLPPIETGCDAWLQSLGESGSVFAGSIAGDPACDAEIRSGSPTLASADAGGILHYRRLYPEDAALRFWAGLTLLGSRRFALAAGEFKAAGDLGFDAARCRAGLAEATAASRALHQ